MAPLLAVPEPLAARGLTLRRERPDDAPFLLDLYKSVRWQELEATGWPEPIRHAFLADQFRLQTRHYAEAYFDAAFMILELDGLPVGRLYLFRGPSDHRIVDISMLPAARNQGIGGALLDAVCGEAAALGRTTSIHVEHVNPARFLYLRKGFLPVGESGPYILMHWGEQAVPTSRDSADAL